MAHTIYTVGIYLVTLLLEKKILHYPTQGFGEKQFPQMQGIDGKLDWNKSIRLPYLPLHAVHVPTEVVVRTDQRATSKHVNLISDG